MSTCSGCGEDHPQGFVCPLARGPMVLDDKYELVRLLGEGGMGAVYEGRHRGIGRRVAVKLLHAQFSLNSGILRRFENEARAAGSLDHENVAAVHDMGRAADGSPYLVMEFLKGEDCAHLLEREGPLPIKRAVGLVLQVCRGLRTAHENNIVHRDLKPANLFLCKRADDSDLVKILDFGIAKLRWGDTPSATSTGSPMGTAYYMSPEQALGEKDVDLRSDVYALGVILYEFLSGKRPHEGETVYSIIYNLLNVPPARLESLRPSLPSELANVVHRAMALDSQERFSSVAELAAALKSVVDLPERASVAPSSSAAGRTEPIRHAAIEDTASPVSQTLGDDLGPAVPARTAGAARPKRTFIAIAAVAAVLVAGGSLLAYKPSSAGVSPTVAASMAPSESAAPLTTAATAPAAGLTPSELTEPPSGPASSSAPTSSAVSAAAPQSAAAKAQRAATRPVAPAQPSAVAKPVVAAAPEAPPIPAAAPKPNCDPNFTLDAQGERHFKPECFHR